MENYHKVETISVTFFPESSTFYSDGRISKLFVADYFDS